MEYASSAGTRDRPHRSVSLSSMRRLRPKASSVLSGSIGWNSPKPAATSRCGDTPLLMRYCTTELAQRGGEPVELGEALGLVQSGPAGVEEHFRLEHEAVADDADVGPIAENHPQPPEEVGTVARAFLHPLRERHVQPLTQIGDAVL